MSSCTYKASRPHSGPTPFSVLAMVLTTLSIAGCSNTSEESPDGSPTTVVGARTGLPKLIDLGATTCVPCKMMAPILEELEVEYAGVLDVSFIDVWQPENKETAESYRVTQIPTQIFFDPDGNELWRNVGFISKEDILAKWSEFGYDLKPRSDE